MPMNRLIRLGGFILLLAGMLACSLTVVQVTPTVTEATREVRNLAPNSSLKDEYPGYVDGNLNATGSGVGGGGGPGLVAKAGNRLNIVLDAVHSLDRIVVYAGCNDGETMAGKVLDISGGAEKILATFGAAGCGDSIPLNSARTDRLAILMTGGGGDDTQISVDEIEIYGR
jgi:hypothetical protein